MQTNREYQMKRKIIINITIIIIIIIIIKYKDIRNVV